MADKSSGGTRRANPRARMADAKQKFLEGLAKGWTVQAAAIAAGVHRRNFYDWRDEDPEFAEAWADAYASGNDAIEQEAFRRAVEGNERPVYIKGGIQVGTVREYSDQLLMLLMRGRIPERYGVKVDLTSDGQSLVQSFAKALTEQPPDADRPRQKENRQLPH